MLLPEVLKGQEHLHSFKFICSLMLSWSSVRQMDVPARRFPFRDLFNHKLMSMKTIDDTLALRISDARFSVGGNFLLVFCCFFSQPIFLNLKFKACIYLKVFKNNVLHSLCTKQTKQICTTALHLQVHMLANTKLDQTESWCWRQAISWGRGVGLRTSLLSEKRGPCIHLLRDSTSSQRIYLCQVFSYTVYTIADRKQAESYSTGKKHTSESKCLNQNYRRL